MVGGFQKERTGMLPGRFEPWREQPGGVHIMAHVSNFMTG